jgi:ADP-heptose:LPS heptosyltransferase
MSRVTVLRALPGLGDLLCAVPALRALAAAGHEVTLVGLPQARALVERFGFVARFLEFPGWPGIPEVELDARRVVAFLAEAQRVPADLALQLHGSGVASAGFVQLLGAARTAGFVPAGGLRPGDGWLTWVEEESEVLRPLRLLEHLGIPAAGTELELPLTNADEREADALDLPRPYAVVHAGSSLPSRRWPAERSAAAADALVERGLTPVLTGTPAEADAVEAVATRMRAPHRTLVGRTSLGAFACVVRDARVVLTNDTGTSHLAAAVRAPSVVLFCVTDPRRWAPLDRERHRALPGTASVEAVLGEADALLARDEAAAS